MLATKSLTAPIHSNYNAGKNDIVVYAFHFDGTLPDPEKIDVLIPTTGMHRVCSYEAIVEPPSEACCHITVMLYPMEGIF